MKTIFQQIGLVILDVMVLVVLVYVSFKYVIPNLDLVEQVVK